MPTTIIVGAGWSGLSCAYYLTRAGHKVTVIEAAPQAGGRARTINYKEEILDNGQHICLGAYTNLRQILQELKLKESDLFKIKDLELRFLGQTNLKLKLKRPLLNILCASDLAWRDRRRLLKFFYHLDKLNFSLDIDCSVLELLKNYQQTDFLISNIWRPLTLAAMTTDIDQASAKIFLQVLSLSFKQSSSNNSWYLPATDLNKILPSQIEQFLVENGSQIIVNQPIKTLEIDNNICKGVSSPRQRWQADNVILATQPWQTANLLQPYTELKHSYDALNNFTHQPITTIYYGFNNDLKFPYPMIGLNGGLCQWVFDRAFAGQPKILSAVISGAGPHQKLKQEELALQVLKEIQDNFPNLDTPIWQKVIIEKRAAFTCDLAAQKIRPQAKTTVENLWLTGDYTLTNLPATLEGAILSGKTTAGLVISPRSNQNC